MIFNSVTFLLFLTIVVSLYWVLSASARLWMLLIASCVFYGFWRWEFLSVMFVSALTDYFTALAIGNTPLTNKRKRKSLLYITLIVNLGLLVYFKYLYFFSDNANSLLGMLGSDYRLPLIQVILPFGISFYTFETISYTVDVYRNLIKPEKKFINYALFVTFFPKLVAGPIQRAAELMPQLKSRTKFDISNISTGLQRILFGLFLKVFLADNISPMVDEGFGVDPHSLSALDVWALAFLFGFQIYFDFSAYSHIAVGAAKLMGIKIPENFNFPYIASSFKDFWKRWHISLSSWIRDYLYLPLTGTKVLKTTGEGGIGEGLDRTPNQKEKNIALFATWAIMGLWHGANWTFILWGLYHATFIFFERQLKTVFSRRNIRVGKLLGWIVVLPLSMLSWVPFRAANIKNSFIMFRKVIEPSGYFTYSLRENTFLICATITLLFLLNYFILHNITPKLQRMPVLRFALNVTMYAVVVMIVFTFLRPISQFIYFQF
jgi:alginate O-acetyltransferase complex protein AlgI